MQEIVNIPLENEMDLVIAGKKSIKISDFLNLSLSSQTTFTTAISEVCREIIEKHSGVLIIGLKKDPYTYSLIAQIKYDNSTFELSENEEGLHYAKRLISQVSISKGDGFTTIELKVNVPKSIRLRDMDTRTLIEQFLKEETVTPYEEVIRKNILLNKISQDQIKKLKESEYLNQKKNEFFSIASHELKTPLTSIKAYSQLALMMGEDECSEDVKGFLKKIDTQATKLNALIQQLLDISKIENGKLDFILEDIDLNAFISGTVEVLKDIHHHHNIQVQLGPDAKVRIDKLRMEQVLTNIMNNAAKYSKLNSSITLSTVLEKDRVLCTITDEGIGMTTDNASRIFDKFFRTDDVSGKYSGFGMGLFITAKIIEDHQGEIWVESTPGKGSSFYFTIPLVAALPG